MQAPRKFARASCRARFRRWRHRRRNGPAGRSRPGSHGGRTRLRERHLLQRRRRAATAASGEPTRISRIPSWARCALISAVRSGALRASSTSRHPVPATVSRRRRSVCGSDPGLRKQRAVRRMQRKRQQAALERRDDLLAGDGAGMTAAFARMLISRASAATRIALANDVTDRLDPGGELANMLASLLAIGVEQRGAGLPFENAIELPDQISDIANALAHALADEGRLLMRGIAGEEYAAAPPFPGDERVKPVARRTPQCGVIRRDPSGERSRQTCSGFFHLRGSSPGSSMISKRRWLPGPMMKVVGRDGSQNCAAVCGSLPRAASSTRKSTTSQGSSNTRSSKAMPSACRVPLEAPSHAIT